MAQYTDFDLDTVVPPSGVVVAKPKGVEYDLDIDSIAKSNADAYKPETLKKSAGLKSIYENALKGEYPEDNEWWKGLKDASTLEKLSVGAVRGAKTVLDTAAHGLAKGTTYVAGKILPESWAKPITESADAAIEADKKGQEEFKKEYPAAEGWIPNATDVGQMSGEIAATAPLMSAKVVQGINYASKALPTALKAAPLGNRALAAAGVGGYGGATYGALTSSKDDKSVGEHVLEGGLTGAVAGPVMTGVAHGLSKVGGNLIGKISGDRADLARLAKDKYGIDLSASDVSASPFAKKADQVTGWAPFSGAPKAEAEKLGQYTRAVAETFGEDVTNITPKVLERAKKRIGNDYETVARNTEIRADKSLHKDLAKAYQDAEAVLTPDQMTLFHKQLLNIADKFDNGLMSGEAWQGMRKTTEPMSKLIKKGDTLGNSIKELQTAMDNAFNRSAPKDMQTLLAKANSQYKSMKTISKLAEADAEGQVSPMRLMSKVVNSPGGKLRSNDLGELADIGRAFFPKPSDSGTPLGIKIAEALHSPFAGVAGFGGGLLYGATLPVAIKGAGGLAANRVAREALNSPAMRDAIIRAGKGETQGMVNKGVGAALPYAQSLDKDREAIKQLKRIPVWKNELPTSR